MSKSYSQDLRDRVFSSVADGSSARGAAARFGIGVSTAIVWVRRLKETGKVSPLPRGKRRGSKLDIHTDYLSGLVSESCDITLHEVQARLKQDKDVHAAIGTLWRFYDRQALTFKKNGARGRAGTS